MGNRATVIFASDDEKTISPAIYLHWNGGPESIYPFLKELDRRNVRADQEYEAARFTQIVGDFFDLDAHGGLSLGISNGPKSISAESLNRYDPGDNGIFVVYRGVSKKVRRFLSRTTNRVRELTPEEVATECEQAWKHKYNVPAEGKRLTKRNKTLSQHLDDGKPVKE